MTGLTPPTISRAVSSRKAPGGVWSSGVPAESSTSMPQRWSSTATRRARWRSGVTRAAVRPGISSAPRIRSASASASAGRSGCSSTRSSRIAAGAGGASFCQAPTVALGRMTSDRKRARPGSLPATPGAAQIPTAARSVARASSSCFRPYCGWPASMHCQLASSRSWSRPGRTTVPRGRRAITWRSARVAGMLPVEPAATIRPSGGAARQRSASARQQAVAAFRGVERALLGEQVRPGPGEDREQPAALLPVFGQGFGDQAIERVERHPLGLELVEERSELAGQAKRMLERPVEGSQQAGRAAAGGAGARSPAAARARGCHPGAARRRRSRRSAESAAAAGRGRPRGAKTPRRGSGRPAGSAAGPACRRAPGVVAGLRQQAGGERVDERQPGGNGGDAHDASVYHKWSAVVRVGAVFRMSRSVGGEHGSVAR